MSRGSQPHCKSSPFGQPRSPTVLRVSRTLLRRGLSPPCKLLQSTLQIPPQTELLRLLGERLWGPVSLIWAGDGGAWCKGVSLSLMQHHACGERAFAPCLMDLNVKRWWDLGARGGREGGRGRGGLLFRAAPPGMDLFSMWRAGGGAPFLGPFLFCLGVH